MYLSLREQLVAHYSWFVSAGARARTPDADDDRGMIPDALHYGTDLIDDGTGTFAPADVDLAPQQGRQKATAGVRTFTPADVLTRITTSLSRSTERFVEDVESHYSIQAGEQAPGIADDEYHAGMKRNARGISRSQYEIYSFSTKYDLPEAATDELLQLVSNVSMLFCFLDCCFGHTVTCIL